MANGASPRLANEAILTADDPFSMASVNEAYAEVLGRDKPGLLRRLWDWLTHFGWVFYRGLTHIFRRSTA